MKDIASMLGAFLGRMSVKWDQATCYHNYHRAFKPGRQYLHCVKCGRDTPGFDNTDIKPPRQTFAGTGQGVRSRSK